MDHRSVENTRVEFWQQKHALPEIKRSITYTSSSIPGERGFTSLAHDRFLIASQGKRGHWGQPFRSNDRYWITPKTGVFSQLHTKHLCILPSGTEQDKCFIYCKRRARKPHNFVLPVTNDLKNIAYLRLRTVQSTALV